MFSMEIIVESVNLMWILNHQNWTCTAQVMTHFSGLLQLRLFNGLCPDFGTVRGLVSELSSKLFCGLLWLVVWNFLWESLCHNCS